MLVELTIRDLALIETLEVELGPGLNVVTGETGAGKSLFVGALELLLGETPKGGASQWVRKGAQEARVEGRFELASVRAIERVRALLEAEVPAIAESWVETLEDGRAELFLGRGLSASGRTKAHVNQRPVPLRALRAIAPAVLEIHGQNEHQRVLEPLEQLRLVDRFGGHTDELADYAKRRASWLALEERYRRLEAERDERRDRRDLVAFQLEELENARLAPGEHARLTEERDLLRSAADLLAALGAVVGALSEDDDAVGDRLRSASQTVERWQARVGRLDDPLAELESAVLHVAEAASALSSFLCDVEEDPGRLDEVEERLAELERLESKYRTDEPGLLQHAQELTVELEQLDEDEESLSSIAHERGEALAALERAAGALADARRALAPRLVRRVQTTLAALGLEKARLDVAFDAREEGQRFGPYGSEDVELFLAANPGEDLAPLRHVASGGEAARIMLALRTALLPDAKRGTPPGDRTLVFDEIDSGVGGRLGPEVAAHLLKLAAREQVLCVTHIPAIAAAADTHLLTAKEVQRGRTRTRVVALEAEERVGEVADMIAGGSDHATARAEARRLIAGARGA